MDASAVSPAQQSPPSAPRAPIAPERAPAARDADRADHPDVEAFFASLGIGRHVDRTA